jgi:hypothetical protein
LRGINKESGRSITNREGPSSVVMVGVVGRVVIISIAGPSAPGITRTERIRVTSVAAVVCPLLKAAVRPTTINSNTIGWQLERGKNPSTTNL